MTGNSDTYYKDDSSQDWGWYWNVRDGLEALCGTKLVIVEKDTWERQSTRKNKTTNSLDITYIISFMGRLYHLPILISSKNHIHILWVQCWLPTLLR